MRTIAVDFDGVIHRYSKGWDDGTIYDPPVQGALGALHVLMKEHPVFVFTSRNTDQVSEWLRENGFEAQPDDGRFKHDLTWDGSFWNTMGTILVTNQKLAASVYIDDRALRFESWGQVFGDLSALGILEES